MTVRVYRSTDASAPTLTGQVGSLVALLDACLVNGYGALSAAGWTKSFSTTNKAAYRQNATGANNTASPMYLYVDDTGPGGGGAREARACGFETMSAITPTGTGQFPTVAQSAIGVGTLIIRKSATADATARAWTLVANGQTIYLFIESGDNTVPLATTTFVFGDFKSYKATDVYAVCIIGRTVENSSSSNADALHCMQFPATNNISASLGTTMMGHYVARHWTGTGGSTKFGKPFDISRVVGASNSSLSGSYSSESQTTASGGSVAMGRNASAYQFPAPNGPDGALVLAPVYVGHNFAIRGYLTGLWQPMHDRPLGHSDTLTVTGGNLNGKSLIAQNIQAFVSGSANGENGQAVVETSDTWS